MDSAARPADQAWLFMSLYKSDAEGNPRGRRDRRTRARSTTRARCSRSSTPGDYVVRVDALLAVAATYDATATLAPGSAGRRRGVRAGAARRERVRLVHEGRRRMASRPTSRRPTARVLHADILRPEGIPADEKTPVILSIGPYFNHTGQIGPAGPTQGTPYDPFATPGPSDRFYDFIHGAKVIRRATRGCRSTCAASAAAAAASTGAGPASRPTWWPPSSGRRRSRGRPARSACTASPTTA